MGSGRPSPGDLERRIRGRWRAALITVLSLVAGVSVVVEVLVLVRAWQAAGEEIAYSPPDPQGMSRLVVMADVLPWVSLQLTTVTAGFGAVAAGIGLGLLASGHASRVARAVLLVAVAVGLATAVSRFVIHANWLIATLDGTETALGPPDTFAGLTRLLVAGVDGLLWVAALIVGLVWRPARGDESQADADDEVSLTAPAAGTPGSVEAGQGGLAAAAGREELTGSGTSVPPPQQVHLSGAGEGRGETPALPDPATGPRLNPDGSSDSGYDEFRFRR